MVTWWDQLVVGCLASFAGILLGGLLGGIVASATSDPDSLLADFDFVNGVFIGAAIGGVVPWLAVLIRVAYRFVKTKGQDSI